MKFILIFISFALVSIGCWSARMAAPPPPDWGQDVIPTSAGDVSVTHVGSVDAPDDDDLRAVRDELESRLRQQAPIPASIDARGPTGDTLRVALPPSDARAAAVSAVHELSSLLGLSEPLPDEIEAWVMRHVAAHDRDEFRSAVSYARGLGCTKTCPWCCFCAGGGTGGDHCHGKNHNCGGQCLPAVSYMPVMHELWLVRDQWHWPGCSSQPFCWPPESVTATAEVAGGVPGCGVGWPWCCIGHCGECSGDCARWDGVRDAWHSLAGSMPDECTGG